MEPQTVRTTTQSAAAEVDFEGLFKAHFKGLHAYATTIVKDDALAEDIVQNTFFKLWERRQEIPTLQSVAAYLYRSVYHESLNHLKHAKVKASYQAYANAMHSDSAETAAGATQLRELESRLDAAMKELPEQCRTIFQLSRFEELKYREIADRLGLSVKTVENQMGKALRMMRNSLAEYLPLLLLLLTLKNNQQ